METTSVHTSDFSNRKFFSLREKNSIFGILGALRAPKILRNFFIMQRITDVWKNLVSALPDNGGRQSFDRGTDKGDELEESFKNLFWTRLISLQVSSE